MAEDGDDTIDQTRMTLGEHLEELRRRLFRGVLALLAAFVVGLVFQDEITRVFVTPLNTALARVERDAVARFEERLAADPALPRSTFFTSDDPAQPQLRPEYRATGRPIITSAGEGFFFVLKLSALFALVAGSPVLLWELWQFIGAGLYRREKRALLRYFPWAVSLLALGVVFGYLMLPWVQYFLVASGTREAQYMPKLSEYMSLTLMLTVALGAIFQLPILMHALVALDLVERSTFKKYRPHFIVAAFIVGGLLTPPDPFTQSMMAVPMILLYEIGLLWTRGLQKPPGSELA